ncbi:MAG: hypothetical protein V2B18_09905, partial [Pseudomonadota bacterium]
HGTAPPQSDVESTDAEREKGNLDPHGAPAGSRGEIPDPIPTDPPLRFPRPDTTRVQPPRSTGPHGSVSQPESGALPYGSDVDGPFASLGVIGSLPNSFVILHSDDELIVLDHHAAHERVLFEDLMAADKTGIAFESQDLLIPIVLECSPVEARVLVKNLELLNAAGFRLEEFGEHDLVVKGAPAWLGPEVDIQALLAGFMETAVEVGVKGDPGRSREELLKSLACRAAEKETKKMRHQEIEALLKDLDRIGGVETCPHGRPMTLRIPMSEIRRKMGRR